jgi:AmmeMemoRadiSam system protein B
MTAIRDPAVSGLFYPADPHQLQAMLSGFLAAVPSVAEAVPKALIAPHAGYIYSGPIAASVYARLAPARAAIRRVVLVGPSHRVPFQGLAASPAEQFATPLGSVRVDQDAIRALLDLPYFGYLEEAHRLEHSLEVHIPFLQSVLEDFSLVPIVAGDASPEQVATVLERLWGGAETLIVISSDLSHYHDYATARRMDNATSNAILALRPQDIGYQDACGQVPVGGLLLAARHRGLHGECVDLRNSGDTAGTRDRVVGYGGYVFR